MMIEKKFKYLILVCLMALFSCQQPSPKENSDGNKTVKSKKDILKKSASISKPKIDVIQLVDIPIDSLAHRFVEKLANAKDLSSFFGKEWTLVYHEDNRCEGSTDGQINHLDKLDIDKNLKLTVKNDGDGWACEKTEPRSYDLNFNLKQKVKSWDRFQIPNYEKKEQNVIYIIGKGESDYLKLYYNDAHLIIKMEYRSEDPG